MLLYSAINRLRLKTPYRLGLLISRFDFNLMQGDLEDEKESSVNNFPCIAAPIVYSPPPATTIASIVGEIGSESQLRRSRSSVVRKSYTSDDELNELNSPLSSILFSDPSFSPVSSTKPNLRWKESRNESSVRYELLRNVWMNSE